MPFLVTRSGAEIGTTVLRLLTQSPRIETNQRKRRKRRKRQKKRSPRSETAKKICSETGATRINATGLANLVTRGTAVQRKMSGGAPGEVETMTLALERIVRPATAALGQRNLDPPDGTDDLARQESGRASTDIGLPIAPPRKRNPLPLDERQMANETTTQTTTSSVRHRLPGTADEVRSAEHRV